MNAKENKLKIAQQVTLISALINLFLSCIKIFIGNIGYSKALIVDGIHSFGDLLTDGFVYWGASIGSLPPDENHPYGHQRIETLVMILLSLFLVIVGAVFAFEAIINFYHNPGQLSIYVIITALISIVFNELIYFYTIRAGKKIHSNLLISNAYHHRSDSLSSCIVLVGSFGAIYGYPWIDSIAALIVSMMIIHLGANLIIEGLNELIDTGVSEATKQEIKKVMLDFKQVQDIVQLRTRLMAGKIFIDAHLRTNAHLSASEASLITKKIETKLKEHNSKIHDVLIQLGYCAYDDHHLIALPDRDKIEQWLKEKTFFKDIGHIHIFYLKPTIEVIVLMKNEMSQREEIAALDGMQVLFKYYYTVGTSY